MNSFSKVLLAALLVAPLALTGCERTEETPSEATEVDGIVDPLDAEGMADDTMVLEGEPAADSLGAALDSLGAATEDAADGAADAVDDAVDTEAEN